MQAERYFRNPRFVSESIPPTGFRSWHDAPSLAAIWLYDSGEPTLYHWLSEFNLALFAAFGYGYRIIVEEKALITTLGELTHKYIQRTKRIIPFVI